MDEQFKDGVDSAIKNGFARIFAGPSFDLANGLQNAFADAGVNIQINPIQTY